MTELKINTLSLLITSYNKENQVFSDYNFYNRKNFEQKGKYKITFFYSTNQADFKYWMGDPYSGQGKKWFDSRTKEVLPKYKDEYEKLLLMFRKVPKLELKSNVITIEVK